MEYILGIKKSKKITKNTENQKYESLSFTFFPHPRMVLQEHSDIKLLNTIDEKIDF
jgi:riboflavin kinase/FMN adenylyltransferase